jgi:hypothetical protein
VEQLRSAILDRARNSPVRNFAREDYRKDTKWIWLGRYFKPHKEEASKAAAFIVPAARPFLFADSDGGSASDGPTDRIALSKRRLKQARFRDDIARGARFVVPLHDRECALAERRFGEVGGRLRCNDRACPELTATVEQIDKSLFRVSQPMFLALVDERRTEADGKLHHLIIDKKTGGPDAYN